MTPSDEGDDRGMGQQLIDVLGLTGIFRRDSVDLSGDGYTASLFPDFAALTHVLRNKREFGRFVQRKARGSNKVVITAPLVASADDRFGYRSDYYLWGSAKNGEIIMGVDRIPLSHRVFNRIFTPLSQARMMKRFHWDTPEGNRIRVSNACGIDFPGGNYHDGVEKLPHIINVLLGLDGGLLGGHDGNDRSGLYSLRVDVENSHSTGSYRFKDKGYTGDYESTVSIRTNAPYQTRDMLDEFSGFVLH